MNYQLTSLLIVPAFLFTACGKQETNNTTLAVPDAVKHAFETTHADVKDAAWKHDSEGFEAEWKVDGMERAVVYDEKGTVLITEEQVSEAQMPESIKPYLAEKYASLAIAKVGMEQKGGVVTYEVELDNSGQELELIFDANGNYLGTEGDDAEADEDEQD